MKTEDLLTELTPSAWSADILVAAARRRTRRRKATRAAVAAVAVLAAAVALLPKKQQGATLATTAATRTAPTMPAPHATKGATANTPKELTEDEFLDTFGDQPVALVTYPDGRRQLLTIVRR